MTIINTETKEENPNMIYGDTNREIDVDIDGSFKANCYICNRDYIAFGLLGGKCVCNDCYIPWYAGIKLAKEECK
tara:strand:+ start:265 stop:489 length:225 start_codon:yes stop_codon:yes gene_type:complete